EGVRLDDVRSGGEVIGVHLLDQLRPGEHQVLVASVVLGAAEIRCPERLRLDERAHCAVENEDPAVELGDQCGDSLAGRARDLWRLAHTFSPLSMKTRNGEPPRS